jgi:hypothetical protein
MKKIILLGVLFAKVASASSVYDIEVKRCSLNGNSSKLKSLEFSVTTGRASDFKNVFAIDGEAVTNEGEKHSVRFAMKKAVSQSNGELIVDAPLPFWTVDKDPSGGKLVLDLNSNKGTLEFEQYSGYGKINLEIKLNEKVTCQNM